MNFAMAALIRSRGALAAARAARYAETVVRDVSPERLARWFVREGNTYCIVKEVREMCIFSQHSIIKDPPFSRLDLISCRNLLIYFDDDSRRRAAQVLYDALKPGGYIFLGHSESMSRICSLFKVKKFGDVIVYQKPTNEGAFR